MRSMCKCKCIIEVSYVTIIRIFVYYFVSTAISATFFTVIQLVSETKLIDRTSNVAAFLSCSRLVASLSGYQYTLKAWRKDVLELLLDPQAFRMQPCALPYWRTITDNLYTHDKTMFKDLLGEHLLFILKCAYKVSL